MAEATINIFHKIPKVFRKTLTLDNGKEFAEFKKIETKTGLDVYFLTHTHPGKEGRMKIQMDYSDNTSPRAVI